MSSIPAEAVADFVVDVLRREGAVWVREASSSMWPLIQPGDELRLVPVDRASIQRGMIVAYRGDAAIVVHRLLSRGPDGIVTKGDALAEPDAPVGWSSVLGRVAALRMPDGRVVDLQSGPRALVVRALARFARLRAPNRLVWILLRLPFYLAARVVR
jgi:signal peptidase I